MISVNFAPGVCVWDVSLAVSLSALPHLMWSCLLRVHTCNPHELMSGVYTLSIGFFPAGVLLFASFVLLSSFFSKRCSLAVGRVHTRFPRSFSGVAAHNIACIPQHRTECSLLSKNHKHPFMNGHGETIKELWLQIRSIHF